MIYKYFLQFCRLPFHFFDGFLCAEDFYFVILLIFAFVAFAFGVKSKKLPRPMSRTLHPMFLSKSFTV